MWMNKNFDILFNVLVILSNAKMEFIACGKGQLRA